MKDPVIIIWTILAIIAAFWFKFAVKSKGRTLSSRTAKHILGALLLSSLAGWLVDRFLGESLHSVWAGRLVMLFIGGMHLWSLYYNTWTIRNRTEYNKDSHLPELSFTVLLSLASSICFAASPRALVFLKLSSIQDEVTMWDAPLLFLLPFLVLKLFDLAGQIPFRVVENAWLYPLEEINTEHWPWRDLIRVNFRVRKSLHDDYYLFGRWTTPWIEVPREALLGSVYRLNMQEHRKHRRDTIQDLGNEYAGDPAFWWLFSVKWIWWKPSSWWRKKRFLDPDLSLASNLVQNGDIIKARRVPKDALAGVDYRSRRTQTPIDPEKTVIINR
ncbi:MAG: hypothetical protein KA479_09545 [Saprospiraceae bacterium]|nr:hypothetical protein [Saprospiraceae bacterium]